MPRLRQSTANHAYRKRSGKVAIRAGLVEHPPDAHALSHGGLPRAFQIGLAEPEPPRAQYCVWFDEGDGCIKVRAAMRKK